MSGRDADAVLARRCERVARIYPDPVRRAEVVTTLLEGNEGRRTPRPADIADVLRHGLVARLRTEPAPGTRYGRLGDALAVACVAGVLAFAVTALVVLSFTVYSPFGVERPRAMFPSGRTGVQAAVVAIAVAVALLAAWTSCRGRVAAARLWVAAAGLAGLAVYLAEHTAGESLSFTSWIAHRLVALGLVVLLPVVCTTAVARSARVVPAVWWRTAFVLALFAARYVVGAGDRPFGYGRSGTALHALLAAYGTIVVALLICYSSVERTASSRARAPSSQS